MPQLKEVYGDGQSRTILVFWTDPPSIIDKLQQVMYDIEVYNPEQIEAVHTVCYYYFFFGFGFVCVISAVDPNSVVWCMK